MHQLYSLLANCNPRALTLDASLDPSELLPTPENAQRYHRSNLIEPVNHLGAGGEWMLIHARIRLHLPVGSVRRSASWCVLPRIPRSSQNLLGLPVSSGVSVQARNMIQKSSAELVQHHLYPAQLRSSRRLLLSRAPSHPPCRIETRSCPGSTRTPP
jgi:hypothetical protein